VQQGKVGSVMSSYNEIDAVPCSANRWLLQDVLRKEWGFKGSVISDYYAVSRLFNVHFIADSMADAARMAINAGVDMELIESECFSHLKELVQSKQVSEDVLNNAVAHVLRHKFMLGLFENPYVNPGKAEQLVGCDANRQLSLKCAHESAILLKNENNIVPLNASTIKTIAVIGPNANRTLLGGYSAKPKQFVTVLDGIKAKVGDKVNVLYSEGCKINKQVKNENVIVPLEENKQLIDEAVQTAGKADVIVLAIGSNEALSAEGVDRSNLDMVGSQDDLVKAMVETGKPVVVLLFNGSPLSINYIKDNVPGIFECWYMGQETGTAIADLLFGDVNPSGKLPITIPRSVGQLPDYYSCKPTSKNPWPGARGGYIFTELAPLYPFGYGLSYTTFEYGNLRIEKTTIGKNESTKVYFTLKNTGKVTGDETAQLYIRDSIPPVTRPILELKGFQKVHLQPGESKELSFNLTPDLLAIWNQDMKLAVNPGPYSIMIGASSADIKLRKVIRVSE
jgi:beta-glucosidase